LENLAVRVHFHKSVPGFFINLYLAPTKETGSPPGSSWAAEKGSLLSSPKTPAVPEKPESC
jgi:hypothetical protein